MCLEYRVCLVIWCIVFPKSWFLLVTFYLLSLCTLGVMSEQAEKKIAGLGQMREGWAAETARAHNLTCEFWINRASACDFVLCMSSCTAIRSVGAEDDALKLLLRVAALQLSPVLPASAELKSLNYASHQLSHSDSLSTDFPQAANLCVFQPRKPLIHNSYYKMYT